MQKDHLQHRLTELFTDHRLIFWYDEGGRLRKQYESLQLEGVEVLLLENNEFGIRYKIQKEAPAQKFLIYSPKQAPADEENWLLDLLLAHYQFQTDELALFLRELELSLDFRPVLEQHAGFFQAKNRRERLKQALDNHPTQRNPVDLPYLMISAILQTSFDWTNFLRELLSDFANGKEDRFDLIQKFGLDSYIWEELKIRFAYSSTQPGLRDFLICLFRDSMGWSIKGKLKSEAQVFLKQWQDSSQHKRAFKRISEDLEEDLGVIQEISDANREDLLDKDLFKFIDVRLVDDWSKQFQVGEISTQDLLKGIQERRSSFWFGDYEDYYLSLEYAALFKEALKAFELNINSLSDGLRLYKENYYRIDQLYRNFCYNFSKRGDRPHLQELAAQVEKQYVNQFLLPLNDAWQVQLDRSENWFIAAYPAQREFFATFVKPFIQQDKKLVVLISDALRYEVAADFLSRIQKAERYNGELEAAWSVLPSYTQLGMAALLPQENLKIEAENLSVKANEQTTQGNAARAKILSAQAGFRATALTAEMMLSYDRDKGRQVFRNHDLIYVYHNVIDKMGDDTTTEGRVFEGVQTTLEDLEKLIKKLSNFNVNNLIVTADHGFLFQRTPVDEGDFRNWPDSPEIWKKSRRFVIGEQIADDPGMKKFSFEQLGLEGEGEVSFPKSINRLKVKGAGSRYVHGGLSLQEIVIPVLHINKKRKDDIRFIDVDVMGNRRQISTNQLTLRMYQSHPVEEKLLGRELIFGFYGEDEKLLSELHRFHFNSSEEDPRKREFSFSFGFIREIHNYQGKDVYLVIKERIPGTEQERSYRKIPYRMFIQISSDFDL